MMTRYSRIDGFCIVNNRCMYNGKLIPSPPRFSKSRSSSKLTTINNKVYLNGWEYFPEERKWKRTPKAIWHYLF
jgi:hypothetical protein